jgi:outer membrane receptor protein involved in Fe transport
MPMSTSADIERVEVLEGPEGTLFGGGARAGAVRYITAKPKLDKIEGKIEGSFGGTVGGAANAAFNAMINLPIIQDKLAVRAVIYERPSRWLHRQRLFDVHAHGYRSRQSLLQSWRQDAARVATVEQWEVRQRQHGQEQLQPGRLRRRPR